MNRTLINTLFFIVGFVIGAIAYLFATLQHNYILTLLSGVIFGIGTLFVSRGFLAINAKISLKRPEYIDVLKIILGIAFILSSLGICGLAPPVVVYYFWFATMFIVGFSLLLGSSYFARKLGRR